jgi:hypothetical protein
MIILKKIDAFTQIFILIGSLLLTFLLDNSWWIFGYFILGAWQIISVLVSHFFASSLPGVFHRGYYAKTLIVLAGLGLLMFAIPDYALFYFYALLFMGPVLAVWYIIISWLELQLWQRRSLIHLK